MTREEARELLMAETRSECTTGWMEDFIDSAVALGLLKLDEPKKEDPVADLVSDLKERGCDVAIRDIETCLVECGLKLVKA